jgi:uncharacterized protein
MGALKVSTIKETLSPVFKKYRDRVVFAYLFGSAAGGDLQPTSDIDIAVLFVPGTRAFYFDTRLSLHGDYCRALNRNDIDIVVLNTATNIIILEEIVRYGIVIYDREPDMREDFELKILHQAIDFREQRLAAIGI